MQKQYAEAYPHLKRICKPNKTLRKVICTEMGFVAAKSSKFDEAIYYYNQLVNSNSEFSQNAYYQLGNAI